MSTQAAVPALGTASREPIQRRRRVTELVLLLLALALAVGANFLVDPERFAEDSGHVLRTAIVRDGTMHVQAGAGIVADSVPEYEQRECEAKSGALLAAAREAIAQASAGGFGQ